MGDESNGSWWIIWLQLFVMWFWCAAMKDVEWVLCSSLPCSHNKKGERMHVSVGPLSLSLSLSLCRYSFLLWSDAMAFCLPSHFSLKFQIKKNDGNGIIYGIEFANFEIFFGWNFLNG